MDIEELREQIDDIDRGLTALFLKRMEVSAGIAEYKRENGLPIFDPERERQKLSGITTEAPEDMRGYVTQLYTLLFELSRAYQERIWGVI